MNPPADPGVYVLAFYLWTLYVGLLWQAYRLRPRQEFPARKRG